MIASLLTGIHLGLALSVVIDQPDVQLVHLSIEPEQVLQFGSHLLIQIPFPVASTSNKNPS